MRFQALGLLAMLGCGDASGTNGPPPGEAELVLRTVATGLSSPVYLTAPPGDARLFVVEQVGRIRIIAEGELQADPFLDLRDRVSAGGERGLLSMAFHPDYSANGMFFVYYTDDGGDTRVERYRTSADPNVADPASAGLVLTVEQPYSNHNGGLIVFGPDGMLYIGLGDGGSGGDPHEHGQNRATLLGSILRIDVDGGEPYTVPQDNPFVSSPDARPEIWAYGLRNPWRFAIDEAAGDLYIADVGQREWEEVNVVDAADAGLNYGWNIMEGAHCFGSDECSPDGLVLPVLEYDHGDGCSVTGGMVYRGSRIPSIVGHYFYADYCAGWVRSFRWDGAQVVDRQEWDFGDIGEIFSFGTDADGELYVLASGSNGGVFRIEAAESGS